MNKQETQRFWNQKIAEYKASHLPVRDWCEQNDIDPNRIWYWLRKEKSREQPEIQEASQNWILLEGSVSPPGPPRTGPSGIVLQLGEVSVEVYPDFEPEHLCRILQTLRAF